MDVLIVDDEKIIRDAVSQLVEDEGHYAETASSGDTALKSLKEAAFDLVLLDVNLDVENGLDLLVKFQAQNPNIPVVVFTAAATTKTAVEAMRRGALDFLEKPFTPEQFRIVLSRVQKHRRLAGRVVELQTQVENQTPESVFESGSRAVREVLDVLFRAASTSASILILGESGTGKSVAAREVHQRSRRADKPFITVHCPGLSRELLESELFGHTKGAFTGAVRDHWGKVKAADGGTLFLDEIGELPLELQPKLLRLLQDREYERIGETRTRTADVRIIAATNRDLKKAVEAGTFREDLFYRLNVITVEMPPLRDRLDDLLPFAENFVGFFGRQFGRPVQLSADARQHVLAHEWPGNLRELRNAIERAVILAKGTEVTAADFPAPGAAPGASSDGNGPAVGAPVSLDKLEEAHIRALMRKLSNLAEVARVLDIDQATLYRKRKKMGLA
ncbi:MAG: sigma-54-dependent Fis family transcriptional regulator [Prosthecobacter sp.]|jgi:NtrC-family two-component system response regulator AlgB|uniref:sigma-54-dependent transcriptional regulator n=1 Tax=Prosthecobacter sp. TaxID=1965333 RepID=UPI0019EEB633|nr:sigma-54 dependent transcriptional regulator [Prosthecobacter sp.]MBE2283869.1 sigma-54-dependent Fis family transcriptional regulator [Prosthecobacter sp.]